MFSSQPAPAPRVGRFALGLLTGLGLPLLLALHDSGAVVPPTEMLPAIFAPGAKIISPAGAEVTVKEVVGEWIRVEGYFSSETVSWIYAPTAVEWRAKR